MPNNVEIRFQARGEQARREIEQLKKEVQGLRQQLVQIERPATEAAAGVDRLGDEAREAAIGVTSLGRNIFKTSAEAKRFGGVFRDAQGVIREANGEFARTTEQIDKIGDEAVETARQVKTFTGGLGGASRGTELLNRGLGGASRGTELLNRGFGVASRGAGLLARTAGELVTTFGAFAALDIGRQIGRFSIRSVQASGQLEQLVRATTQIEGSAEAAERRMEDLREIADLPGLNFEPLTRYSNRLRAAGVSAADTNTILLTVGQTILSLGGSADKAALSMEQIIQAIQLGEVDFRDFRTIVQQIPGFLEALGDVHGVEANIMGLHDAYEQVGGSIIDILIPTFEELERRFESPPLDSYIVRIDALQNAFFHAQAAIGDLFLPTVTEGARVLTEFLEAVRIGTKDLTTLPEPIQEIVAGAQKLYEGLRTVAETIIGIVGPPVGELADAFGGLLGEVLELAGVLLTALEPGFRFISYVVGTVVQAIAQLTDHLGTLIGGLAEAVDWLAFWSDGGEKAKVSTENLAAVQTELKTAAEGATQAIEGSTTALTENATAGDQARAKLRNLVAQLETVNATIERYEERLRKAQEANNTRDIDFYTRGLETQRERAAALSSEIGKLGDTYGDAGARLGENATALEQQEARLEDLQTELQSANQEVERSNQLLEESKERYTSDASPAVQQYERRVTAAKEAVSEINTEIEKTESQINQLKGSTDEATGATDENTETVKQARVEYTEYRDVIARAQREIQAFGELNENLRGFGDFWRVAAGQAGEYSTAVNLATVSVADHQAELDALVGSGFFDGLDDPIADYVASLEATSVAADSAFGALNRVDTSVRETGADFRVAAERLRDFDAAFELTEATIPRATSAMREFTETAPSVNELAQEVELLNETFQATEPTLTDVDSAIREITTEIDRRTVGAIRRAESSISGLSQTFADLALETDSNTRAIVESILEIPDAIETLGAGDAFAQLGTDFGIAFGVNFVANVISELTEGFEDSEYKRAIQRAFEPGRVLEDPDAALNRAEGARTLIGGLTGTDLDTDALESLLDGIRDNQLGRLSSVQERIAGELEGFFGGEFEDPFIGLRDAMDMAAEAFESAEGVEIDPALQNLVSSTNDFFDSQIEIIRIIGNETGQNLEGLIADINTERQNALNAARQSAAARTPAQTSLSDLLIDETTGSGVGAPQPTEGPTVEIAQPQNLEAVIASINEDIGLINASITEIETQIGQASEPAEIAELLSQIPDLIREKYQRLRDALNERYNAGEISIDVYNASLQELETDESAALEQNSDAVLANTIGAINEDVERINASITEIETQIDQLSEPTEIAELLSEIPGLITEKYQRLRDALDARYAAGEISVDAYNASLSELASNESVETERNSDAMLANALRINQEAVARINTNVSSLENAIAQSNDPAEIARLLQQIAAQIPDIYRLRREGLQQQFNAGEITKQALETGLTNLGIEESAAVERNSDAQLANALRINQEIVANINTEISALENAIAQSNDPAEIQRLLQQIAAQIPDIYRLRREALQAQFEAGEITRQALETELASLNIEESAAIERNSDAVLANALRINQGYVESIDLAIRALELQILQTDAPAEIISLLGQIAEQIPNRYELLREALSAQYTAGEITFFEFVRGIQSIGLDEGFAQQRISARQARAVPTPSRVSTAAPSRPSRVSSSSPQDDAQRRIDEQLAQALQANQEAVDAVASEVSGLENAISQSNDPEEITALLQQIAEQIPETYRLRREALQTQFNAGKITQQALETGLANLGIEESAAIEQNSDQQLANALRIHQQNVESINTNISALQNTISQSNDPAEIATLLQQIAEQIPEIYRLRREALQAQFDAGEITRQTLETGLANLNIEESAAIEQNSDQQLANALSILNTDAQEIANEINTLNSQIETSNDPAEIQRLLIDLREAVMEKYRLQREVLQSRLDAEEITIADFNAQLGSINFQEAQALRDVDASAANQINDLNTTANALLQNAIQRAQFRLTGATTEQDFETRRQELIRAINEYYDAEEARISALGLAEDALEDKRQDNQLARDRALRQAMTATNRFTEERVRTEERAEAERIRAEERAVADILKAEEDLLNEINELRDASFDAERERQEALVELEEETQEKIEDIHRKANQTREDIAREFQRDVEDQRRDYLQEYQAILDDQSLSDEERNRRLQELEQENVRALTELGRQRNRDLEDVAIRVGRQVENQNIQQQRAAGDIDTEADTELAQLQQETAIISAEAAALQQETALVSAETAALSQETAITASESASQLTEVATLQGDAATGLSDAAGQLQSAARVQGLFDAAESLEAAAASLAGLRDDFATVFGPIGDVLLQTVDSLALFASRPPPPNYLELSGGSGQVPRGGGREGGPAQGQPQQGGRAGAERPIELALTIKNDLTLPDGAVQDLGDTVVKQRIQGRSLL